MLRFLGVRHLAVIDHLEVEFEPGLNILTGETGAGKSILVEAIDLLVGGRANADLVRTGEETATVQALFERPDGGEVIVRREVSAQGRSRAFIDDTLATSAALRELGASLLDLHGQHEHQALLDPADHIRHLDATLHQDALVAGVAAAFQTWRAAEAALDRSRLSDREKQARVETATFQWQDIQKVAPAAGEDDRLVQERTVLANADKLSRLSQEAYALLYDGDESALAALAGVWKRVADLASLDPRFAPYAEQRETMKPALEDLAEALRSYASDLDASPDRLQAVEDRLAALERVKRKYGPALADVIAKQHALADELHALEASDEQLAALAKAEREAREAFLARATELSDVRSRAAVTLARGLERALGDLAMPQSRVDVRVAASQQPDAWSERGVDRVEFFLSPNPGEELRPLARIASGGELSRIMLALRTLVAVPGTGRTLVFDEVDAGIGGIAADAVGARLQALGRAYQVLCITHLPQIAARAGTHFQIGKRVRGGRTSTELARLDAQGRELEVARMIAGAEVAPHVLASARELLASRRESEDKTKGEGARDTKAKGGRRGA